MQEPLAGHEIQDAFLRDAGAQGRGCREFDKSKLRRTVRIGAEGNPAARLFRNHEQVRTKILPVRIGVDFDGFVQFRCLGKDPKPVRSQTRAVVIDAPARMTKNLKGRIAQGREITACLILLPPQGGMEAADDDIKFRERFCFHVAFTCGVQVQFQGPQNPESIVSGSFESPVNRFDFSRLLFKLSLVDPAGDLQALARGR